MELDLFSDYVTSYFYSLCNPENKWMFIHVIHSMRYLFLLLNKSILLILFFLLLKLFFKTNIVYLPNQSQGYPLIVLMRPKNIFKVYKQLEFAGTHCAVKILFWGSKRRKPSPCKQAYLNAKHSLLKGRVKFIFLFLPAECGISTCKYQKFKKRVTASLLKI